jgi:hypothetical protein
LVQLTDSSYIYGADDPVREVDPSGLCAAVLAPPRSLDSAGPICRNWHKSSYTGAVDVDARPGGSVAWQYKMNALTKVLYSDGNPIVTAVAYKNGRRLPSYRYDKRTEPAGYPWHSNVPGQYASGDNFSLEITVLGRDPEGKPRRLIVSIGCIIP